MDCKFCHYPNTKVIKTMQDDETNQIYRRRVCDKCHARFTTREHLRDDYKHPAWKTSPPLKVIS